MCSILLISILQASSTSEAHDGPHSVNKGSKSVPASNAFSRFIKHYLTNRFGLKKLVEQQAWELIDGLHNLQHVRN